MHLIWNHLRTIKLQWKSTLPPRCASLLLLFFLSVFFPLSPLCLTEQSAFNLALCEDVPFPIYTSISIGSLALSRATANSSAPSVHFLWPPLLSSIPDFISHWRRAKRLLSISSAPFLNLFALNSPLTVFAGVVNWLSSLIRPWSGDTLKIQL